MNVFKIWLFLACWLFGFCALYARYENRAEEFAFTHVSGEPDLQMKLYPNPFRNVLEFDLNSNGSLQSVQIRFVNLIGKEMDNQFSLPVNSISEHFELDLKTLPSGVYFMEISARFSSGALQKFTRKVTKF